MGFVVCLVCACFGVLYCLIFVTQPMGKQAPNDVVLFEILKTVLVSMISIIGTLMAVGHGSNATASPIVPKPMVSPPPVSPPPAPTPKPIVRPLSTPKADDDDEPVFKGAKE
jgi:hypothetical protein